MKLNFPIILLVFTLLSCTQNISPKTYSVGSVGQINRSIGARVVSVREIDISGSSRFGTGAGGIAGAVAGSTAGGSDFKSNVAGALAGAAVGAVVGNNLEQGLTAQKGAEYVLETENGNLITIVQGIDPFFEVNDKVLILYGSPSRVIADPRGKK